MIVAKVSRLTLWFIGIAVATVYYSIAATLIFIGLTGEHRWAIVVGIVQIMLPFVMWGASGEPEQ